MLKELQNGAPILAQKPTRDGGYIVMARPGGYHPFATWFVNAEGHAFHGHYFVAEADALSDFNARH